MVDLVRAGRTPEELAREFEPTANTIRKWVEQLDRNEGLCSDGLTIRPGDRDTATWKTDFARSTAT